MTEYEAAEIGAGPAPLKPVNLADYAHVFQQVITGAELRADTFRGVVAQWHIRYTHEYDRAPSEDRAIAMVTQMAEQMRIQAIRELGLEPILEAQRAEVRKFQEVNQRLQALCDSRGARIADLEDELEAASESTGEPT